MDKIKLDEFQKIREQLINLMNIINTQHWPDELVEQYINIQSILFNYDLSAIPFEEWKGMTIMSEDYLDLSSTHANLDFSLLEDFDCEAGFNLKGCNLRNLEYIDNDSPYTTDNFDDTFVKKHPEYFPDESLPDNIKQKYYERKIEFEDLITYPQLIKSIHSRSFSNGYSPTRYFVDAIGFNYAMQMFEENPDFIEYITKVSYDEYGFEETQAIPLGFLEAINPSSYEEVKHQIYDCMIQAAESHYLKLPPRNICPPDFVELHPELFFDHDEMPEEIQNKFYNQELYLEDLRDYKDILKKKNLKISISSSIRTQLEKMTIITEDIWSYIDKVPRSLDNICFEYIYNIPDTEISNMTLNDLLHNAIITLKNQKRDTFDQEIKSLTTLSTFAMYVPIQEIIDDENVVNFINQIGIENILEFNKKHNNFLELTAYYDTSGFNTILKYISNVYETQIKKSNDGPPNLDLIIEQSILAMKKSSNHNIVQFLENNNAILYSISPSNFFSDEELEYANKIINSENQNVTNRTLIKALNGDTDTLIRLINSYPALVNIFETKEITLNASGYSCLDDLFQRLEKKTFLQFCSEYGKSINILFYSGSVDSDKLVNQIISAADYHQVMNRTIYQYILSGRRKIDIRTLPDSFKNVHKELYLPKNAPKELQDSFYGGEGLNIHLLSLHPEWNAYLTDIDLVNALKPFSVTVIDEYQTKRKNNIISVLKTEMTQQEILTLITDYGQYIDNCNLSFTQNKGSVREQLLENIYNNIIRRNIIDYQNISDEFKEKFRGAFLSEDAPSELKEQFYSRKIDSEYILLHPEYHRYLYDVNLEVLYPYIPITLKKGIDIYKTHNLITLMQQKYGKEYTFNVMMLYGKQLSELSPVNTLDMPEEFTIEELLNEFDHRIYEEIHRTNKQYSELISEHFKNNYPSMFLPITAPQKLREKFYQKTLTFDDFRENPEWFDQFDGVNLGWGLNKKLSWIIDLFSKSDINKANIKKFKIFEEFSKISDYELENMFKDYIISHEENLDMSKIPYIAEVLSRLSSSNSQEIYNFRITIAEQLLELDEPIQYLSEIEEVFIKNNIPTVGKLYSVFNILHPDFTGFDFSSESSISPVLKKRSSRSRSIIVFSDLIKASFGSNNRSVRNYLDNLELGNQLYENIINGKMSYNGLNQQDKKQLELFYKHLQTLYEQSQLSETKGNIISGEDLISNITAIKKAISPNGTLDYNLADRAVAMFCHFAGFDTLTEARQYMQQKIESADAKNRSRATSDLVLEPGDLIKGIGDIEYLGHILQNGSVSKEYLGHAAGSDATPLDTDLSRISSNDGSNISKIAGTEASGYGPIFFVLKNDDRFVVTRDSDKTELDINQSRSKLELFYTGAIGLTHYGIRTGFSSSDIDYIMCKGDDYDERIGLEIALNGFYIPVALTNGKIVFTPEDYDKLRSKMAGLSELGCAEFEFAPGLITDDVLAIVEQLPENAADIDYKKQKINHAIEEALNGTGHSLKTEQDGDLTDGPIELIDTGSTGRNTNKPYDGDFDFIMRLDRSVLSNPQEFDNIKKRLLKQFGKEDAETEITGSGDFRLKGVQIDDITVDIDISFTQKTDRAMYSTDKALEDRLNTIKRNYPEQYPYVLANVILAKQVLKEAGAYKPNRGDTPQGGLGGVGVENWILQNGGSFLQAATSFLEASKGKSFEEFQKTYKIWNFGSNHLAIKNGTYPHNNFVVDNMSEEGYEKMRSALLTYVENMSLNQGSESKTPTHSSKK